MFLRRFAKQLNTMFSEWKNGNTKDVVGLDIGSDSLKLLKINSTSSPFIVENFAIINLPLGTIEKNQIKNFPAIVSALKECFRKAAVTTKEVALAIPRSSTIIKTIPVDKRLGPAEIEARAWVEANRHFPDLVGDIYLDFSITGAALEDTTQNELVLVACRKEQIDPYIEAIRQAGLSARIMDVNSYALERALNQTRRLDTEKTIALLNLDLALSTLIIEHEQNLIYAHDQSFDGHRLLSQIEKYHADKSTSDEAYQNILKENLTSHLRHSMHFFFSSRPNISIQKLMLTGDCALIANLAAFVAKEIGIATVVTDPFATMTIHPFINQQEINHYAPACMLSCGLALSSLQNY